MFALIDAINSFLEGDNGKMMYWAFALAGSGIFILTGAMQVFGGGLESVDGADLDMDGNIDIPHDTGLLDFKLISFRSVLAFIAMFGWGGVVWGSHGWWGFAAALTCGGVTMLITALAISMMLKLQQSGTKKPEDFIGKDAVVYLEIPKDGTGKITVTTPDATVELKATADQYAPKGTSVKIVSVKAGNTYKVNIN